MERTMTTRRFSPVTPLRTFFFEIGVSTATGKKLVKSDPDFPRDELVQVAGFGAQPRIGITQRGKDRYQQTLADRAKQPRVVSPNLRDPRAAAARSVEVRRGKAAPRRAEQNAATPGRESTS
jgi:hypothetical protein